MRGYSAFCSGWRQAGGNKSGGIENNGCGPILLLIGIIVVAMTFAQLIQEANSGFAIVMLLAIVVGLIKGLS